MKFRPPPSTILAAAVGVLAPYVPGLSPTILVRALLEYVPDGRASGPVRPALSKCQAAERLNLSLSSINRRIADGTLPSVKIGGSVRIPSEAVEQLLSLEG